MRSFASDNNSGVHPLVMEALNRANQNHAVGYFVQGMGTEYAKLKRHFRLIVSHCLFSMEQEVMRYLCSWLPALII